MVDMNVAVAVFVLLLGGAQAAVQWHLGGQGESCNVVCARRSRSCDLGTLRATTTSSAVAAAAAAAGAACTALHPWGYATNPGVCTSSECCGGSCVGICTYGSHSGMSCDKSDGSYSRLCPCEEGAGPVEAELVRPGSWHWSARASQTSSTEGFSFYTRIFKMWQEGHPLNMQMGMAGSWITPTGIDWSVSCACNPSGWPSALPNDPSFQCCSTNQCRHLYQTFEGGPGYWIGELPTTEAKWRINSATGCYSAETSTPLFNFGNPATKSCSSMGVVQVSNRLLLPPDGITFAGEGMLGVAYLRTPVGKKSGGDNRNFWTLVVDSKAFSGPVMYFLPDFFGTRAPNTSPNLADFGTPGVGAAMGGGGFEWNTLQAYRLTDGSGFRIPKMRFPQKNGRSVLMMNNRQYNDASLTTVLEAALAGGDLDVGTLQRQGTRTLCNTNSVSDAYYKLDTTTRASLGSLRTRVDSNGECEWSLEFPPNTPGFDYAAGTTPRYFGKTGNPLDETQAPAELRAKTFPKKSGWAKYDALSSPPAGTCATSPGPSPDQLFCVQTRSPSWVAYKWYRFVDQPALGRAGLTDAEKRYMQGRVEQLHTLLNAGKTEWLGRGGAAAEGLAEIEGGLVLRPPRRKEVGYVPVAVYEGTAKPSGCTTTTCSTHSCPPGTSAKVGVVADTPCADCDRECCVAWRLSALGQSCNAACAAVAGTCHLPSMVAVTTAEAITAAAGHVGVRCTSTRNWGYSTNPGVCTSPDCCQGGCVGACAYGTHPAITCSTSSSSAYSRLCACEL